MALGNSGRQSTRKDLNNTMYFLCLGPRQGKRMAEKKLHLPATCGALRNVYQYYHCNIYIKLPALKCSDSSPHDCHDIKNMVTTRHPAKKPNAKCKFCQRASKGCKAVPKKGKEEAGNEAPFSRLDGGWFCRISAEDLGRLGVSYLKHKRKHDMDAIT